MESWLANFTNTIHFEMMIRLFLSAVLGGIVGMERGSGDRPAGFRTHILVCAGSALLMMVSLYGFDGFDKVPFEYPDRRDSSRIAAQVVSGIGFLGAGTILHEGITVRGLTTAASLWMISAIGLATGAGMFFISIAATFITFLILTTFHTFEKRVATINNRADRKFLHVVSSDDPGIIPQITSFLALHQIKVKSINVTGKLRNNQVEIDLYLKMSREQNLGLIMDGIQQVDGVISVENIG
ncbi:MAG: MgtC/SapB family protein [Succiniclasticum sp.]|uniref:MgtC/SapB family protein n=1 Tax=Succiniclasticum sp. TaxID=2775030 RepID=UPI002A909D0C|nr:MgtC/SapB family protein [Succiniclasticum sp.]MDY6290583.1 MgtC/SapB family protein [Succiniclasticum sp.]